MSRGILDETAESVSRDQVLRRDREQGNIHFLCSAYIKQDRQPHSVDPYSAIMRTTYYIHTVIACHYCKKSYHTVTYCKIKSESEFEMLLLLLIHTFSVLSLQLKKQRQHNKSVIDRPIEKANPARGLEEVRRSTGYIMVTTRYSNQQGSKSRQHLCQVQPTENIGNLSASRRCLWIRTTVSTVWSAASISESELQATKKTVWCVAHPTKSSNKKKSSSRRVTRRQVMRYFISYGTD